MSVLHQWHPLQTQHVESVAAMCVSAWSFSVAFQRGVSACNNAEDIAVNFRGNHKSAKTTARTQPTTTPTTTANRGSPAGPQCNPRRGGPLHTQEGPPGPFYCVCPSSFLPRFNCKHHSHCNSHCNTREGPLQAVGGLWVALKLCRGSWKMGCGVAVAVAVAVVLVVKPRAQKLGSKKMSRG